MIFNKAVVIFFGIILFSSTITYSPYSQTENKAFAETSSNITDVSSYVLFGFEKVKIEKNVTITNGNIGTNNADSKIKVEKGVTIENPNSSLVGNIIKIEKDAIVTNVFYNELDNKGTISGTENTPLELPVIDNLPEFPDFEAGYEKIKIDKNESGLLPPGDYGKIKLKKGSTVIFEGGVYNIESINASKDSQILFENTSEIRVEKDVKLDKRVTLGPHPDSEINAADIVFFVKNGNVKFGKNTVIDANIFALDGKIKMDKDVSATGSFIANKIKIEKNSIITLDSAFNPEQQLANEYLALIEKLDGIGSVIDQTTITQELIDETQSDLDRIKEIVIELQLLGFDGEGTVSRVNNQSIGNVMFFDENTGDELFNVDIPDGTLAIFSAFGLFTEFEGTAGEFTFEDKVTLLNDSLSVVSILTTQDEETADAFVLASIGAFHPSTGNTFIIAIFLIHTAITTCLATPSCVELINQLVTTATGLVLDNILPIVFVTGSEFNDLNSDGIQSGPDEVGVGGFEYTLGLTGANGGLLSENPTTSNANGNFAFTLRIPITITNLVVTQSEREGWTPTTDTLQELTIPPPSSGTGFPLEESFGNVQPAPPGPIFFEDFDTPGALDDWIGCVGNPFCTKTVATSFAGFDPPSAPNWGVVTFKALSSPFCSSNPATESISKDFIIPESGNYEISGTIASSGNGRTAIVQVDTTTAFQKTNGEGTFSNTLFLTEGSHRITLSTKANSFCGGASIPAAFDNIKVQ